MKPSRLTSFTSTATVETGLVRPASAKKTERTTWRKKARSRPSTPNDADSPFRSALLRNGAKDLSKSDTRRDGRRATKTNPNAIERSPRPGHKFLPKLVLEGRSSSKDQLLRPW